ncbi:MAG: GNAT family N-acetyltransferase, partial [bacterium]
IAELHRQHNHYYRETPIFMPNRDEDPLADLNEWFSGENRHLWVAMKGDQAIGYMRIQPQGESVISLHPLMMNITGAYVVPEERGSRCGTLLLDAVSRWGMANGYPLTGVDFESINPAAAAFWMKHFTAYAYSLTRRIDERILNFQERVGE